MKQGTKSTPKLLRKTQFLSNSNINKEKLHLPSRYVQQKLPTKNETIKILSCTSSIIVAIQSIIKTSEVSRIKTPNSPVKLRLKLKPMEGDKKKQISEFKPKPLKRQQSDFEQYKEIFIKPIKQNLDALQQSKPKTDPIKLSKEISKDYERLLEFESGVKKKVDISEQFVDLDRQQVNQFFDEAINILSKQNHLAISHQEDFYEQQIKIEPPDLPNSTMASTVSPGSGYAPSIPFTSALGKQNNLKQLLIRAKAGMNTEDIQKQAHLSFYLAMVYEEQRNYRAALKFYRRYLGFARGIEDKIGMALGANRVAINYFNINDIEKSIIFHNQNLKLSDNENCFAGFYNLGICHRRIQNFDESIEYFETALQWASQKGQTQSECLTLGQIGITYKYMQLFQQSLEYFQKSLQYCYKLKRTQLQLKNLTNILMIASKNKLYGQSKILQLIYEAYECAKLLLDKKLQQVFAFNIGIIKGKNQFNHFVQNCKFESDIEEV